MTFSRRPEDVLKTSVFPGNSFQVLVSVKEISSNELSLNQKRVFDISVSTIHVHNIQKVLKFYL